MTVSELDSSSLDESVSEFSLKSRLETLSSEASWKFGVGFDTNGVSVVFIGLEVTESSLRKSHRSFLMIKLDQSSESKDGQNTTKSRLVLTNCLKET